MLDVEEDALFVRNQLEYLSDDLEPLYTGGSGCFISFSHSCEVYEYRLDEHVVFDQVKLIDGDVEAELLLHLKDGIIDNLEIWCYTSNYGTSELKSYTLSQEWEGSSKRVIKRG